tara:strand:- start:689 stop:964 length:276 start_codon:yes stop_codon:yes gene_type:complete
MFKWLLKKYYKDSPKCNCGWAMKPFVKYTECSQWKCIWKDCGWETFDTGDGKLHWWKQGIRPIPLSHRIKFNIKFARKNVLNYFRKLKNKP